MTQEIFNEKMKLIQNWENTKAAVAAAMRMSYYHPNLAKVWFENQLMATMDHEK